MEMFKMFKGLDLLGLAMMEDNLQSAHPDFYRDWSCNFGSDGVIQIKFKGTFATHTAEGWIDICKGMRPSDEHIKAFMTAIHWHFGPGDAHKVMQRYLQVLNQGAECTKE